MTYILRCCVRCNHEWPHNDFQTCDWCGAPSRVIFEKAPIEFKLTTKTLQASTRKLSASWTVVQEEDETAFLPSLIGLDDLSTELLETIDTCTKQKK